MFSKSKTHKTQKSNYVYVFGYGSLMYDKDRQETTIYNYPAIPVIINKSFKHSRHYSTLTHDNTFIRAMILNKSDGDLITGSIFKVPPSVISRLNKRESHYVKTRVPWKHVNIYNKDKVNKSIPLYTYIVNSKYLTKKNIKSWKYYLDLTIIGHLQYGLEFTKLFFKTCKNLPDSHKSYNNWLRSTDMFSYRKDKWNN